MDSVMISNREEMLKYSYTLLDSTRETLLKKGLSEQSVENIIEILKDSIKFGFDQGVIHGHLIGQREVINLMKGHIK